MPSRDGDGWVDCACGEQHWGIHGAAGIAIVNSVDATILLQHRAKWTHSGETWALPGGAIDSHEDALTAAIRELAEELGIFPNSISVLHEEILFDHGLWRYHTVIAELLEPIQPIHNQESVESQWVQFSDVADFELHPAFSQTWPQLRELIQQVTLSKDSG